MKSERIPTPVAIFGACMILQHLDALVIEIAGVRSSDDIEYIHRMRVASRRLRNAIPIFQPVMRIKKMGNWSKEIRKITRALGAARDLDVQIEALEKYSQTKKIKSQYIPGIRRLILRLNQKRVQLQDDVSSSLDHFESSGTSASMHLVLDDLASQWESNTPPHADLYKLSHQVISDRLSEFFLREWLIHNPENILELHAQRIAAKHLRYTMELFSLLYASGLRLYLNSCRKFQDQLGAIHDCDVWIAMLPEFMECELNRTIAYFGKSDPFNLLVPGLNEFENNRKDVRTALYSEFIADWDVAHSRGIWQKLRTEITSPLIIGEVFPRLFFDESSPTPLPGQ